MATLAQGSHPEMEESLGRALALANALRESQDHAGSDDSAGRRTMRAHTETWLALMLRDAVLTAYRAFNPRFGEEA